MVKFVYKPWETVVIHEIVQYDSQTLMQLQSIGVPTGQLGRPVNWANGVAFRLTAMPPTSDVIKEQIIGKIHWSHLAFAFMPKHQSIITIPDSNIRIPIINVSKNELFWNMAEWLTKKYKP